MYQIDIFHTPPHDYTRLHMNVEAVFVITRLSIYYKESQLDSCGYVISYQLQIQLNNERGDGLYPKGMQLP